MTNMQEKIIDITEKNHDRTFMVDASMNDVFTYRRFHELTMSLAALLSERGINKNDRLVVCLPNGVEIAALYFACFHIGSIIVPLNTNLNPREIDFIVLNSRAKLIIYSPSTEKYLRPTIENSRADHSLCFLTGKDKSLGLTSAQALDISTLNKAEHPYQPIAAARQHNDPFAIMYTSGTTGVPKGVVHSFENMSNNASKFITYLNIGPNHRFYNVLSMAYMAGFFNLTLLPFLAGGSVVIGDAFSAQSILNFWKNPMKYEVNTLWLVPTILSMMLKLDRDDQGIQYCRKNIKYIFVGTAPLPVRLRKDFEEKYGAKLYENYGLSETLFIAANSPSEDVLDGSVGKLLPGCTIAITEQDGRKPGLDREGEIILMSGDMMLGYTNAHSGDIEANHVGNAFNTGDIGYITSQGHLFITGRKKDIIIRGGINLSPAVIENTLMEHKAVERVAVVGIPNALYGEEIAAILRLKDGYRFEDEKPSFIEHCRIHLSPTERPALFFEIEEFPLSATGKIDKNKLRMLLSEKLKSQSTDSGSPT